MSDKVVLKTIEDLVKYRVDEIMNGNRIDVIHTIVCDMLLKECSMEDIVNYVVDTFSSIMISFNSDVKNSYEDLADVAAVLRHLSVSAQKDLTLVDQDVSVVSMLILIYKKIEEIMIDKISDL